MTVFRTIPPFNLFPHILQSKFVEIAGAFIQYRKRLILRFILTNPPGIPCNLNFKSFIHAYQRIAVNNPANAPKIIRGQRSLISCQICFIIIEFLND